MRNLREKINECEKQVGKWLKYKEDVFSLHWIPQIHPLAIYHTLFIKALILMLISHFSLMENSY